MNTLPNFEIKSGSEISDEFLKRDISTFHQAIQYIQNLKYGRNSNKDDLKTIFDENKGTCSIKHAILKQLANENRYDNINLMLGIFKMNSENTPSVRSTLSRYNLTYIPEAHNYLKYGNNIFDFTSKHSSPATFADDLLIEMEILPHEIGEHKIQIHKAFLKNWLTKNKNAKYSLEEIWTIREQCIQDLSQ